MMAADLLALAGAGAGAVVSFRCWHGAKRVPGAHRKRDRFLALDPSLRRSLRVGRSLSGGKYSCVGGKKYAPHF